MIFSALILLAGGFAMAYSTQKLDDGSIEVISQEEELWASTVKELSTATVNIDGNKSYSAVITCTEISDYNTQCVLSKLPPK
jgi:hypothetical protein